MPVIIESSKLELFYHGMTAHAIIFKQSDLIRNGNKCSRLITVSFKVSSHPVEESFGPQPGKRDDPTLLKPTVTLFISHYHVICRSPGRFFHHVCGTKNMTRCGRRRVSIHNTWPIHRSLHNFILLQSVWIPFPLNTHFHTSRLLTLSLNPALANFCKQVWSNTLERCTS